MEVTAAIPSELIPLFRQHEHELQGLTLREALLFLQDKYRIDDNTETFWISHGWQGMKQVSMSRGARLRLLYANLMSRPIMLQFLALELLKPMDTSGPPAPEDKVIVPRWDK